MLPLGQAATEDDGCCPGTAASVSKLFEDNPMLANGALPEGVVGLFACGFPLRVRYIVYIYLYIITLTY